MRTRTVRKVVWVVVLAAVAAAVVFWARRDTATPEETWRTEAVGRGSVAETVSATGTLSAVTTVQIGSQVSGIVARLHADFNSPVRKGQLLAELDPTPFQAQVEQRRADLARAEVQARSAKITLDRQERLRREGLSSEAEYDAARADWEGAEAGASQSRAALQQSLTNLTYTRILSPIDGVVVDRQYDVGQTVAASFQAPTLFTIAQDLTKMQVQADVDQSDIGRIQVGQPARFTVDAWPDEEFEATIAQIRLNATENQNVITYPVILTVDNPEEKLRPKMTANVTIEISRVEDALRVPNAALRFRPPEESGQPAGARAAEGPGPGAGRPGSGFSGAAAAMDAGIAAARGGRGRGNRQTIHRLQPDGTLEPVPVRTGISDGRYTVILEGEIREGDRVITGALTSRAPAGTTPLGMGGPGGPGGGRGGRP